MARTKIPVALRLDPELKAMAETRAKEERRSFAGFLEWLIVEDGRRQAAVGQKSGTSPVSAAATKSADKV
jgi:hypothetical protein